MIRVGTRRKGNNHSGWRSFLAPNAIIKYIAMWMDRIGSAEMVLVSARGNPMLVLWSRVGDTAVGGSGEREANSDNWYLGKFKSSLCFRLAIVLILSGD